MNCVGCLFAVYELEADSDGNEEWVGYCGSSECFYESSPFDLYSPFEDFI